MKSMEKKYEALGELEQGSITHLNISLDDMFNVSDVVITYLQELFKNFFGDGKAKYPSDNLALLVQQINAVTERLTEVPELPRDMPLLILTGTTKCSVPKFFGKFELMLNTERIIQLENEGDRHDDMKLLKRAKKLTMLASNSFHS